MHRMTGGAVGVLEQMRDAALRAAEETERLGSVETTEGREALLKEVDLDLQFARHLLDFSDHLKARTVSEAGLEKLMVLESVAAAMPGVPGLRLDAHQILGTVLLSESETDAAVEELRIAASFVYEAQPDERPIAVVCPLLEDQLMGLWRGLERSPQESKLRASIEAVRTMRRHLESLVAVETKALRGSSSAHGAVVDGPFYAAASRLVERPLRSGSDARSVLERCETAAQQPGGESPAVQVPLAEALLRVGRFTDAVAVVERVIDHLEGLDTDACVTLSHRAVTVVLHALRSDLGVRITGSALDAILARPTGDARRDAELEAIARFAYARALSEHDDDVVALQEIERADRNLRSVIDADSSASTLVEAALASSYLAFLRQHGGDDAGADAAMDAALELGRRIAEEHPEEDGVLGAVIELAMASARRRSGDRDEALARAAVDLVEVAFARDPADLAIARDLYNAVTLLSLVSDDRTSSEVEEARRRARELLAQLTSADPDGLVAQFLRGNLAEEEAFLAVIGGRETAFRWKAQDCVKLHDAQIATAPGVPASLSRKASTCLHFARAAAGMRDRKLARRMLDAGVSAARRQVELQPDVITAHEALVTRLAEAEQVAASIGDDKLQHRMAAERLDATRVLTHLGPHDVELQYGLLSALTSAVAVVGQGTMRGVEHLFDEASALLEELETLDPMHPRRRRFTYEIREAEALRANEVDDHLTVVRSAVRALRVPYGGMVIRHHHGDQLHDSPASAMRVDVLAYTLQAHLEKVADVIDAEELADARSVLLLLSRSGVGPRSEAAPSPEAELRERPGPEDSIPEILAPAVDADLSRSAVSWIAEHPAERGVRTFMKPMNGGHPRLHFGVGLAASEDLLVVGSPGDPSAEHHVVVNGDAEDRSASRRGAVHIHRRSENGWIHEAYLKPDIAAEGLEYGWSVDVDGSTVAVGAPTATFPSADPDGALPGERLPPLGGVWTYIHDGTDWRPEDFLLPDDDTPTLRLGTCLALQGDVLFASGIDWSTGHGVVHEFVRDGTEWRWRSVLRSPRASGTSDERLGFGYSLALDGDALVVGEPHYSGPLRAAGDDPVDDLRPGAAWVFRRDARGRWQPEALLLAPTPRFSSMHGGKVAMRDGLVAVTAALHPVSLDEQPAGPARAGAVTLYGRTATGWEGLAALAAPDPHSQELGGSIAITSEAEVVVGSALDAHGKAWTETPGVAGGRGPRYGAVHVISATPEGWRFTGAVVAGEPTEAAEFGSRVAISGADLVVAAPNDSSSGRGVGAELHDADASESGAVHVVSGVLRTRDAEEDGED